MTLEKQFFLSKATNNPVSESDNMDYMEFEHTIGMLKEILEKEAKSAQAR